MNWNAHSRLTNLVTLSIAIFVVIAQLPAAAQSTSGNVAKPWMDNKLSPDERADLVLKEMMLAEKISLLHGTGMKGLSPISPLAAQSNGGAGYVVGIPRLGIPASRCPTRLTE